MNLRLERKATCLFCVLIGMKARNIDRVKPQVASKKHVPCCWGVRRFGGLSAVPTGQGAYVNCWHIWCSMARLLAALVERSRIS